MCAMCTNQLEPTWPATCAVKSTLVLCAGSQGNMSLVCHTQPKRLRTNHENLICELVQKSKADTFTYFKVSTKLAKIINTDVVYNIELYKLGTELSTVTSIDKAYRYQSDLGTMKENLINKTRFYDFVPNGRNDIILRHDGFKNLIKIIVRGRPFM